MAIVLIVGVAIGASMGEIPSDDADLRAAAESAYQSGLEARADSVRARAYFVHAAELFETLWDRGTRSVALARNMAQSRLLAGDLGRSIRDYRRGLRHFPHDPDLKYGLTYAREQVTYPVGIDIADAARPADIATPLDRVRIPVHRLAWVAVGLSAVGWFVLARAWFTARGGMALFGGALVFAAVAVGGWLWWEDQRLRTRWTEPAAVVIGTGTDLRTGNSSEYPKRLEGKLLAGAEVKVLGERGGWLHVELAGGAAGWLPRDRVVEVD